MREILACRTSVNVDPIARSHRSETDKECDAPFAINCLLRRVRFEGSPSLLSRINYRFPAIGLPVSEVIKHAERLNVQLKQSKVFVVKDLDGDRGHFLQMDSVLQGEVQRAEIAAFLTGVAQDVKVLLTYFQQENDSPPESLGAIAQRCNQTKRRPSAVA